MSLDVDLIIAVDTGGKEPVEITLFSYNITHNLNEMAKQAGIYKHLWHPEALGITEAAYLIAPLRKGLELLKSDPVRFSEFNASNGWGTYEHLVKFVTEYQAACEKHPAATVHVSR